VLDSTYTNKSDLSNIHATTLPRSNPNVAAEKARREKPFNISSTAIKTPPSPKPMKVQNLPASNNSGRTWLMAKPPTVHSIRNNMRMIQSAMD